MKLFCYKNDKNDKNIDTHLSTRSLILGGVVYAKIICGLNWSDFISYAMI